MRCPRLNHCQTCRHKRQYFSPLSDKQSHKCPQPHNWCHAFRVAKHLLLVYIFRDLCFWRLQEMRIWQFRQISEHKFSAVKSGSDAIFASKWQKKHMFQNPKPKLFSRQLIIDEKLVKLMQSLLDICRRWEFQKTSYAKLLWLGCQDGTT